jgi:hypothetical protein
MLLPLFMEIKNVRPNILPDGSAAHNIRKLHSIKPVAAPLYSSSTHDNSRRIILPPSTRYFHLANGQAHAA